jgi:hypothetical protein
MKKPVTIKNMSSTKLILRKEILRELAAKELHEVVGGEKSFTKAIAC